MQDQQLRKLCGDAARQLFLLTPSDGARSTPATAAVRAPPQTHTNNASSSLLSSSASASPGTEELQRACDAVVRHAMTLHRLCRRAGGGGTIDIVLRGGQSSISSGGCGGGGGGGGGGVGTASAAEEAVFCVCVGLMTLEPRLWAALVRRAQLLRQHRPSLRFVPPVTVPPVMVKEVERFHGRSRHLVSATASGFGASGGGRGGCATRGATAAAAETGSNSGMTARQAEAVAACFVWKSMTPAERVQRRAVLELRVDAGSPAATVTPSSAPTPASSAHCNAVTGGARSGDGPAAADGADVAARRPPLSSSAAETSSEATRPGARSRRLPLLPLPQQPTTLSHLAALGSSTSYTDGLVDWMGVRGHGQGRIGQPELATWRGRGEDTRGGRGGARVTATALASSSTSDDDDDDRGGSVKESRSGSPGSDRADADGDANADAAAAAVASHAAPASGRHHHHPRPRDGDDAAVLARLYAAALSSEAAEAAGDVNGDTVQDAPADELGARSSSNRHGVYAGGAAAAAAARPSMFTADKGLGLVSLAASVTHVRDALHWSRLRALVRCPLLFRTLPWSVSGGPCEGGPSVAMPNTVPLRCSNKNSVSGVDAGDGSGEALTTEAMRRLSRGLRLAVPGGTSTNLTSNCSASPGDLDAFLTLAASAASSASVLSPVRLRTAAPHPLLLPPPASLVTEGFLWIRLLICGTWLLVYADGLADETDDDTHAHGDHDYAHYPRVQPTPAVRATVAYCVAVVREARAMSCGLSPSRSSAHEWERRAGAVCCPVCDELLREQQLQPALWWSTLREDRAALQAQVRSVLESSSVNAGVGGGDDAGTESAVIAAALVHDLSGEGRGRRFGPELLSGSESAWCRVAALQQRWAAHVMQQPAPNRDADSGAAHRASHRLGAHTTATAGALEAHNEWAEGSEGDEEEEEEEAAVLWAALTQRVAAAAELSAFLSSHPTHAAVARAEAAVSSGSHTTRRRRRLDEGDDGTSRGGHNAPHRGTHDATSSDEAEGAEEHGRQGQEKGRAVRPSGAAAFAKRTRGAAAHGSRQAMEEAEEWGRLLRRCGWVNAAAPSPPPSPVTESDRLYADWVTSLFAPEAVPTPDQAATLRRRWSCYTLADVVRKMVLGRGGNWARYARLLFGVDVHTATSEVADDAAAASLAVPKPPPPPRRAASLSLLMDNAREEGQEAYHKPAEVRAGSYMSTTGLAATVPHAAGTSMQAKEDEPRAPRLEASSLLSIPLHVSPLSQRRLVASAGTAGCVPGLQPTGAVAGAPPRRTETAAAAARAGRDEAVRDSTDASPSASSPRREQLRAQREALHDLLRFRPRLPALREEDAVLECAACFSLFHQGCIAPVQRDVTEQAFLCHVCRLRWARPYTVPGGGVVHQEMEQRRS